MSTDNELFSRLVFNRMHPDDVNECLKMSQGDFLTMLCDGIEKLTGERPTRIQFADLASISHKTVYAYFASPEARDHRTLSDDMRIAIIWRIAVSSPAALNSAQINRYGAKYIVDGELLSGAQAAQKLKYASYKSFNNALKKNRTPPGADISALKNTRFSTKAIFYVVHGSSVSMNKAAKLLGFNATTTLRDMLLKQNIPEGADISHLRPRRYKRRKNKNEG